MSATHAQSLQTLILKHPLFTRTRLSSLYSDFRPLTTTNPDGYTANISAWLSLLADAARHGLLPPASPLSALLTPALLSSPSPSPPQTTSPDTLVLTINANFLSSLAIDGEGRPLAIGAVISEALKSKYLIPLADFLTQSDSIYTGHGYLSSISSWLLNLVPALGYGKHPLDVSEDTVSGKSTEYVVIRNLDDAARGVLAQFVKQRSGRVGDIWTINSFMQHFANPLSGASCTKFSATDAKVLLRYLERDLNEISISGDIIKFKPPLTIHPVPITPTDIAIANLKSSINQAHLSLSYLEGTSVTLSLRAKSHLAAKNKLAALTALRSKRVIDNHASQRASSLSQLETLLLQIETAVDNVELVKLLEQGGTALKSLNEETGGVNKVDEVLEQAREAGANTEEISRVLNTGLGPEELVNEENLEIELEAMVREEEAKQSKEEEEVDMRQRVDEYNKRAKEAERRAREEAVELANSLSNLELIGSDVVFRKRVEELA